MYRRLRTTTGAEMTMTRHHLSSLLDGVELRASLTYCDSLDVEIELVSPLPVTAVRVSREQDPAACLRDLHRIVIAVHANRELLARVLEEDESAVASARAEVNRVYAEVDALVPRSRGWAHGAGRNHSMERVRQTLNWHVEHVERKVCESMVARIREIVTDLEVLDSWALENIDWARMIRASVNRGARR